MKQWGSVWPRVVEAVRNCDFPADALLEISALRGGDVSMDSLDTKWRRMFNEGKVGSKLQESFGVDRRKAGWEDVAPVLPPPQPATPTSQVAPRVHYVIGDTQCKPGVAIEYFHWMGRHIQEVKPDVVVHLGDHWDMPSLSSYDSGVRKAVEGRCKKADIDAGNAALEILDGYIPRGTRKVLCLGNHDAFSHQGRVGRYLQEHPEDAGLLTVELFYYHNSKWEVVDYLKQIVIDGIRYSHTFPVNALGKTTPGALRMGAGTAAVQLAGMKESCTAGHKQGFQYSSCQTAYGELHSIIVGSTYLHSEQYMGPGNNHWRGVVVKRNVIDGDYDFEKVSLDQLRRKYG